LPVDGPLISIYLYREKPARAERHAGEGPRASGRHGIELQQQGETTVTHPVRCYRGAFAAIGILLASGNEAIRLNPKDFDSFNRRGKALGG
jgi:hypothetical protein